MRHDKMRHYGQHQKRQALYNLSSSVSDYYSMSDSSFNLSKEKWMAEQERRNRENDRG